MGSQFPNQELNLGHGNDESEEELEPLDEVKEESEKAGFKLNIWKMLILIMASSPSISWQTEGEKVEAVTDFILLGSKITGQWLQVWN